MLLNKKYYLIHFLATVANEYIWRFRFNNNSQVVYMMI